MSLEIKSTEIVGPAGTLALKPGDEIARKLAMLMAGECERVGPALAAKAFGYSRQRYFQLRAIYEEQGALGLRSDKRGPKRNYRRSTELVCQAIRHRFLDPDASSEVIAQKLRQCGFQISKRSVDRVFFEFGLQKKTLSMPPRPPARRGANLSHQKAPLPRSRGPGQSRARRPATLGE
jgi:hypothetical protein